MKTLLKSLGYAVDLSNAQKRLIDLRVEIAGDNLQTELEITRELDSITDRLVQAESDLTSMDALMKNRFLYASTSGRIQRLRITESGKKIAAGAYVLEIAPLTTDFEVISEITVSELPYLDIGQFVSVQLSGSLPRPVTVPAQVAKITKVSANARLVSLQIEREDLNKRDLLVGGHALSGVGEQSQALISVPSDNAWQSLIDILIAPRSVHAI